MSKATNRYVVVVDRGWIFAGDLKTVRIGAQRFCKLSNAVHVFSWSSVGFPRMIAEWQSGNVDLRRVADVEIPCDSVIFRVPVPAGWGIK